MVDALEAAPGCDLDPYEESFLVDPHAGYAAMRRAGPVFRLERYRCYGMARHAEVHAALQDWRSYSSAAGVGLTHFGKEKPWRPPSLLLETDPPLHDRMRAVVDRVVAPASLRHLREIFAGQAVALVDRVVARGRIDGAKDLAEAFPLRVFADAVGLGDEGRDNLLPYGDMVFNGFGPLNERFQASMKPAATVVPWINAACRREALAPGGLGAEIYRAADAGDVAPEEAALLVRSFLSAGLDTTVAAIGSALLLFAENPGEWQKLRADRGLARSAFEETIRLESPIQNLFRTTTKDVDVGGTRVGEGEKVLLFLASANRDPDYWSEPTRFDITRKLQGHLAFGFGLHACVGQVIARLEAETLFTALAERVAVIELAGQPTRRLNNAVRGVTSLPLVLRT
jgi:4-methoxybenzoate monooxygenase (O-demethylating)